MTLQNVWEVCKFSDEIIYGKLDMSKFAVELHSVLDGTANNKNKIENDSLLKLSTKSLWESNYFINSEYCKPFNIIIYLTIAKFVFNG
jgi:hypothetical protein